MRVMPASLTGRIAVILIGGLLMAQACGLFLLYAEGEQIMLRSGFGMVPRIDDMVNLLDSVPADERTRFVQTTGTSEIAVSLQSEPIPLANAGPAARARALEDSVRHSLQGEREVRVSLIDPASNGRVPLNAQRASFLPADMMLALRLVHDFTIIAQVRLKDGTWAVFDTNLRFGFAPPPMIFFDSLLQFLAVLALTFYAVRLVTRPLHDLSLAAEELGNNIHRPSLSESGPAEVARAAKAFNTMQQRLIRHLNDRTRILAAVSHDLKTPLTRLKLRADALVDPVLRAKFCGDLDEMSSMVNSALDFMRGLDSEEPVGRLDVTALLESLQRDAEEMGQDVAITSPPRRITVEARPNALKRCIRNLIDNAVKYGGGAQIFVQENDQALAIRITDQGPGIPAQELQRVFDPFYRVESSRNRESGGTGLGLSIAHDVAILHGGTIVLENRPTGGLEARLLLPLSAASATHEQLDAASTLI